MSNLSLSTKQVLNKLFGPGLLQAFYQRESALDILVGDWLYDLYAAATGVTLPLTGDLSFDKEVNHLIYVSTSTTTNANGGNLTVRAGAKDGSGTDGVLTLGESNTSAVSIGASGVVTTFSGPIAASAAGWNIADPGNAGAIPVTRNGVCNLTSDGAETRTLSTPSFQGQRLDICMDTDGGDIVLTVNAAFNQSGNTTITFNDAGDHVELVACTIGGTRRWRLVVNNGCTLG